MRARSRPDYVPALVGASIEAVARDDGAVTGGKSLLCLVLPAPRLPRRAARIGGIFSLVFHLVMVTLLLAAARSGSVPASSPEAISREPLQLPRMVFLQMPGRAGRGGGGGKRQSAPPSRAQDIERDRLTLPVARRIVASRQPHDVAPQPQHVVLDAKPLVSGAALLTGLPDVPPSRSFSQGSEFGVGVGEGTGTGIGAGTGPGLGPGSGGGFGGGAYRPGGGVVAPTLLKEVKPKYTPEALQRKIQGTVVLEVVVGREGIPIAIRVARSVDPGGLDEEAIAAVGQWRFTPGRLGDTPVDVLVTVWVDFRIV